MGGYGNLAGLLKSLPFDPENEDLVAVDGKLREVMSVKGAFNINMPNSPFLKKLDGVLGDEFLARTVEDFAKERPAFLNRMFAGLTRDPASVDVVIHKAYSELGISRVRGHSPLPPSPVP